MNPQRILCALTIGWLALMLAGCKSYTPEQEAELRAAYERYLVVISEAYRTGDPSLLSEVATGDWLSSQTEEVQRFGGELMYYRNYKWELLDMEILEYSDTFACFVVDQLVVPYPFGRASDDDYERWKLDQPIAVRDNQDASWKILTVLFLDSSRSTSKPSKPNCHFLDD